MNQKYENRICKLEKGNVCGLTSVLLENGLIQVGVLPEKGADIYKIKHLQKGIDFLWKAYDFEKNLIKAAKKIGSCGFLDCYEGGWQELFPSIGKPCEAGGILFPMHGEVATKSWQYQVLQDTEEEIAVLFWVETDILPFKLERTVRLRQGIASVYIDEAITNRSDTQQSISWGHHPALGGNFLDENCVIEVPGNPHMCAYSVELGDVSLISACAEGTWPNMPAKHGGTIDLSKVLHKNSHIYMEFGLLRLPDARYVVNNQKLGIGFGMKWDKNIFPHLWIWQMFHGNAGYPFFGTAYTLALEPWSAVPGGIADAIKNGQAIVVDPDQKILHSIEVFIETTNNE